MLYFLIKRLPSVLGTSGGGVVAADREMSLAVSLAIRTAVKQINPFPFTTLIIITTLVGCRALILRLVSSWFHHVLHVKFKWIKVKPIIRGFCAMAVVPSHHFT